MAINCPKTLRASLLAALGLAISCSSFAASTVLPVNWTLTAGSDYPFGTGTDTSTLRMTLEGELQVINVSGTIVWRSGTSVSPSTCSPSTCYAKFQGDHNLVITLPTGAVNFSNTGGKTSSQLTASTAEPYLSIANAGAQPYWTSGIRYYGAGTFTMTTGQRVTVNGVYLSLTAAGSLEVRSVSSGALLWGSGNFSECASITTCYVAYADNGTSVELKLIAPANGTNPMKVVWTTGQIAKVGETSLRIAEYNPYITIAQTALVAGINTRPIVWGTGPSQSGTTHVAGNLSQKNTEQVLVGGGFRTKLNASCQLQMLNNATPVNTIGNIVAQPNDCSVRLMNGDLTIKNGTNLVWQSDPTNQHVGSYLRLSAASPYFMVETSHFDLVWDAVNGLPQGITQRYISAPVRGNVPKAETAFSFTDFLGVTTHRNQYQLTSSPVLTSLALTGIKHVRDWPPQDSTNLSWYTDLATAGIKFNFVRDGSELDQFIARVKSVGISNVDSLEGRNEINNGGFWARAFQCNGGSPSPCGGIALSDQAKLNQQAIKDPALGNLYVYDFTGGVMAMHAPSTGLLDFNDRADKGNVHVYPNLSQPGPAVAAAMGTEYWNLRADQGVMSEGGYRERDVGQRGQAVFNANLWFDAYTYGYKRLYMYMLTDESAAGERFGIFSASNTPKPIAYAIRNINTILQEPDPTWNATTTLNWSASSNFDGRTILLQNSSGHFFLVVWREPDGSQVINNTAAVQNVTFTFPASRLNYYYPFDTFEAAGTVPKNSTNPTIASFNIKDEPLIIEVILPTQQ